MLEPVMSAAALPRLYDQTESTTDVSHVELLQPGTESSGVQAAGLAQRRQELTGLSAERQGPAGTRVLPPQVVQQAVSAAAAKKASQAAAAQAAQAAQASSPGSGAYSAHSAPPGSGAYSSASSPSTPQGSGAYSAHSAPPGSGAYSPVSGGPVSPTPSSMGGQAPGSNPAPSSGSAPITRGSAPDPRSFGQGNHPSQMGAQQHHSGSSHPPPHQGAQGNSDLRMASQPPLPHAGHGHVTPYPGHVHVGTMRLQDEPSSMPGSGDQQTQVYRPTKPAAPRKKQSIAVYVLGALAFAIVGFGIVYAVQLLVRTLGQ